MIRSMGSVNKGARSRLLIVAVALVLGGCIAHAPARSPVQGPRPEAASRGAKQRSAASSPAARARRFVGLLAAHDFQTAATLFDEQMKAALSPDRLAKIWADLEQDRGTFKTVTHVKLQHRGAMTAAIVELQLARGRHRARVVFDARRRVTGLWFKPVPPSWEPPPYARAARFREEDVTVGSGEWATPGTLSVPSGKGPFPALILVHGSGPNDRDESSASGPQRVFKDLAWGLASRGIAVLRYDKRTLTHGRKLKKVMHSFTQREEYVEDALAAVELLRADGRIDPRRIFVLGHSEGGSLAPRIGAASKHIRGLVVLAGSTRDFATIIIDQLTYLARLDGDVDAEERARIEDMRRRVQPLRQPALLEETPADRLPFQIPAAYWKDELAHPPVEAARAYRNRMLILQGERDYQVTMADFAGWKKGLAGRKQVTFRSYPRLDHHFVEGEGPSRPEQYRRPGHVAKYVIDDIAAWIERGKISNIPGVRRSIAARRDRRSSWSKNAHSR
jgi:dienelactone hydrolase